MSTYFDIVCRDCQFRCGLSDTNHKEAVLLHVVHNRHVVEACGDLAEYHDVELKIDYLYINTSFFVGHKGHKLGVMCEYESFEEAEVRFEKGLTWDNQSSST